jgi:hypothetical protein
MYDFYFTFKRIGIRPVELLEVDAGRDLGIERGRGLYRCRTSST